LKCRKFPRCKKTGGGEEREKQIRRRSRFVQLGIAGQAIVRGDELPFAGDFHPDVGQAIAIVVGFSVERAAFVIGRDHHRRVFVDVNLDVRQFSEIHVQGPGGIADEADPAVGAAVFQSDDVVFREKRGQSDALPLLIGVHPHFNSRVRMLPTSDFSCARFGTARNPSRQRTTIENIRARIGFREIRL